MRSFFRNLIFIGAGILLSFIFFLIVLGILNYFGILQVARIVPLLSFLPKPILTQKSVLPIDPAESFISEAGVTYLFQGTIESITATTTPNEGSVITLRSSSGAVIPNEFFIRKDNTNVDIQALSPKTFVNVYYYVKLKPASTVQGVQGAVTKIIVGVLTP